MPLVRTALSDRETEILHLFSQGFSDKEVAGMLFVCELTVHAHRTNIKKVLQARNIAHAVAIGKEKGII